MQDSGRLLDFGYQDPDITSLRRQMRIPVSLVSLSMHASSPGISLCPTRSCFSDLSTDHQSSQSLPLSPASSILSDPPQPRKKRRISTSSLSDADDGDGDEDEDEDEPLAARMAIKTSGARSEKSTRATHGQRSGKKTPAAKSKKAHTTPISLAPPVGEELAQMNGKINGVNGHDPKVKVEDMMDEGQLTRLAAGVTVDTAGRASAGVRKLLTRRVSYSYTSILQPPAKTEKAAIVELRKGVIKITPVENDKQPRSLVILTGLKTLFQKQLPNMPREYIARLVYDANSKGVAIIKRGYKVVGGICYRPFPHRGFAEIVFFATASADQEKV